MTEKPHPILVLMPVSAAVVAVWVGVYGLSFVLTATDMMTHPWIGGLKCALTWISAPTGWFVGTVSGRWMFDNWNRNAPRAPVRYTPPVNDYRTLRVEVHNELDRKRIAYYHLPPNIDEADLKRVAAAISDGASFSHPGLVVTKILKRSQFEDLQTWMIDRKWARWNNPNSAFDPHARKAGAILTRPGKAALESINTYQEVFRSIKVHH